MSCANKTGIGIVSSVIIALCPLGMVQAAAPISKVPVPGFARMMVGDFQVTPLSDGDWALPVNQLLLNTTGPEVDAILAARLLKSPLKISTNAYLVNTGARLVLVDTGAGATAGTAAGAVLANLKAAGYAPEQVDDIYITHMHNDHMGGLVDGKKLVFPNAIVHADKHDVDYWLSPENLAKAGQDLKPYFQIAVNSMEPYIEAGRFKAFDGNTDLMPGVKAIASYGHTEGHTIYSFESKGQKLVLWGDLLHVGEIQFDQPDITLSYDTHPEAAIQSRKQAFAAAAADGAWVAVAHLPFPGVGRIKATPTGYTWLPASSAALP